MTNLTLRSKIKLINHPKMSSPVSMIDPRRKSRPQNLHLRKRVQLKRKLSLRKLYPKKWRIRLKKPKKEIKRQMILIKSRLPLILSMINLLAATKTSPKLLMNNQ